DPGQARRGLAELVRGVHRRWQLGHRGGRARSDSLAPLRGLVSLRPRRKDADTRQLASSRAGKIDAAGFARRAAQIRNIYAHSLENEQPELDELIVFNY